MYLIKKAVLLKCSDNPEDVKEILIGANPKHLFIYCIRTSGSISGGGGTWKEGPGSFRQVGGSAAIGMWEPKDEKIDIQFQLTNEDNTSQIAAISSCESLICIVPALPGKLAGAGIICMI